MKVTIVPILIGTIGIVSKKLLKGLEDLEVGGCVETIQMTALLRTSRWLRRVQVTWGDLLSLKPQWKTSANTDVKNPRGVNNNNNNNNNNHHHIVLAARISLTLSRHSSLSFIALGRSSGQQPVSSHSCWMYVRAGRPAFARPCVGIHKSTSLMSSSLLLQQCPACLVRLTWIVFVIGGKRKVVIANLASKNALVLP